MKRIGLIPFTFILTMILVSCQQTKIVIRATDIPPLFTATPNNTQTETVSTIPILTEIAEPTVFYSADRVSFDFDDGVPLSREEYATIDISEQFKPQFYGNKIEDWEAYGSPATIADFRSRDPVELGLYLQGYPNLDGFQPDDFHVYKISENEISVVTVNLNCGDDAILDVEKRTDLVFSAGTWQVTWTGYRQRCRRNHNDDWVKGLCP